MRIIASEAYELVRIKEKCGDRFASGSLCIVNASNGKE
jgi:hypothetical protein